MFIKGFIFLFHQIKHYLLDLKESGPTAFSAKQNTACKLSSKPLIENLKFLD